MEMKPRSRTPFADKTLGLPRIQIRSLIRRQDSSLDSAAIAQQFHSGFSKTMAKFSGNSPIKIIDKGRRRGYISVDEKLKQKRDVALETMKLFGEKDRQFQMNKEAEKYSRSLKSNQKQILKQRREGLFKAHKQETFKVSWESLCATERARENSKESETAKVKRSRTELNEKPKRDSQSKMSESIKEAESREKFKNRTSISVPMEFGSSEGAPVSAVKVSDESILSIKQVQRVPLKSSLKPRALSPESKAQDQESKKGEFQSSFLLGVQAEKDKTKPQRSITELKAQKTSSAEKNRVKKKRSCEETPGLGKLFQMICGSEESLKTLRMSKEQFRRHLSMRYNNPVFIERTMNFLVFPILCGLPKYVSIVNGFLQLDRQLKIKVAFYLYDVNDDHELCYNDMFGLLRLTSDGVFEKEYHKITEFMYNSRSLRKRRDTTELKNEMFIKIQRELQKAKALDSIGATKDKGFENFNLDKIRTSDFGPKKQMKTNMENARKALVKKDVTRFVSKCKYSLDNEAKDVEEAVLYKRFLKEEKTDKSPEVKKKEKKKQKMNLLQFQSLYVDSYPLIIYDLVYHISLYRWQSHKGYPENDDFLLKNRIATPPA